jgi:hypothetical protein
VERQRVPDVRHLRWSLLRCEARTGLGGQLLVSDAPRLDHALLAERQRDERAELDDLRFAEVLPQTRPERIVDGRGIPDQVARVLERDLLPLAVVLGALEVEQVGVVRFGQLLPRTEGALRASVVAADRLGDVVPAELLERMLDEAAAEDALPAARERPGDVGDVRADRLRLRAGRPELLRMLHVRDEFRIGEPVARDVADACHGGES